MSFLEISECNYNAKPTLSFLLCCCLHLWYNFSSIFARLLLPDLLPPRGMSAPGIAGGTAVPCPTGGTNSRALAEEKWRLLWEVQGVSGERLPRPLCSQGNKSRNLPRDAWRWQDEASLCARLAHHLATQGKHSSMYVLSQQLSTFFLVKNCTGGLVILRNTVVCQYNRCTGRRVGQSGTGGYFCGISQT